MPPPRLLSSNPITTFARLMSTIERSIFQELHIRSDWCSYRLRFHQIGLIDFDRFFTGVSGNCRLSISRRENTSLQCRLDGICGELLIRVFETGLVLNGYDLS